LTRKVFGDHIAPELT